MFERAVRALQAIASIFVAKLMANEREINPKQPPFPGVPERRLQLGVRLIKRSQRQKRKRARWRNQALKK